MPSDTDALCKHIEELAIGREVHRRARELAADVRAAIERRDARIAELERLLRNVVVEADFVLSGGDDPHDRCTECGCAGYGMLRDALRPARAAITPPPKDKQ